MKQQWGRVRVRLWRPSTAGIVGGIAFVIMSTAPSLLPRTWLLQGAVSGLTYVIGDVVGRVIDWLLRSGARALKLRVSVGEQEGRVVRAAFILIGGIAAGWTTIENIRSQNVTAVLVELRPLSPLEWVGAAVVAVVVAALIIGAGHGIRAVFRWVNARVTRAMPRALAAVVTGAALVVVAVLLTNVVVVNTAARFIGNAARAANSADSHVTPPTSPLLSGSPESTVPFDSLGFEGQRFIGNAATVEQITAATGAPATQPIRVYSSLGVDGDLTRAADTVVTELQRTGAFDRSVVAVFISTGTGWVNEWSAQSVEYLTGGNCAIASMQYSYLPSPLALIANAKTPENAASILIGKVRAAIDARPVGQRPRLVASGESLGAYGGNGAFTSVSEELSTLDGAVWSGTPSFTPLMGKIANDRVQGSPEISPVLDSGQRVRFVSRDAGLTADYVGRVFPAWGSPRIVFVQHPSDPVVWWQPSLALSEPDWLREPRGRDVNPAMNWLPFVTFWQLSCDMALGLEPPYGHGHRYGPELVNAWAAVLGGDPQVDHTALVNAMTPNVPTLE